MIKTAIKAIPKRFFLKILNLFDSQVKMAIMTKILPLNNHRSPKDLLSVTKNNRIV